MVTIAENSFADSPKLGALASGLDACFHCGEPCNSSGFEKNAKQFCCRGCLTVHGLLTESGLGHFYDLGRHPGVRLRRSPKHKQWAYLDEPDIGRQLFEFSDENITKVTFQIPAIHCIACVWLLENLFQLHPAIGRCVVNFPKREAAIGFATGKIALSELVALLASIGYEPELN